MRVPGVPYVQGRNAYTDADGTKYGVAIHNTANDATAEGEASYATRRTDGISAHFYCDADSLIQSLDTTSRAGHAGSSEGNQNAVAVEITGTNAKTRQWWLDNVDWPELGRVLAIVCKHYGIAVRRASVAEMRSNPKVRAFYGHNDMRLAWGGTTHTDPGPNYPWDKLFASVNAALAGEDTNVIEDSGHGLVVMGRMEALVKGYDTVKFGPTLGEANWTVRAIRALATAVAGVDEATAARLRAEFDQLDAAVAAAGEVDEAAVAAQLLAVLTPQAIAAAIPPELAKDVADELAARLSA